jgi:hypothetical protein
MKQLGRQLRKEGCVSDEFSRVLSIDNGVGYICCSSTLLLLHCRKLKLVWNQQHSHCTACKRDSILYVILSIQTRNDVNLTNFIYKHIIIFQNIQGEQKKEGENLKDARLDSTN